MQSSSYFFHFLDDDVPKIQKIFFIKMLFYPTIFWGHFAFIPNILTLISNFTYTTDMKLHYSVCHHFLSMTLVSQYFWNLCYFYLFFSSQRATMYPTIPSDQVRKGSSSIWNPKNASSLQKSPILSPHSLDSSRSDTPRTDSSEGDTTSMWKMMMLTD